MDTINSQFINAEIRPILGPAYLDLILPIINQTKINLCILSYNWAFRDWERNNKITILTKEVMAAQKRGVICKIVLNAESQYNYITIANSRTIKKLNSVGCAAKLTRTSPTMHSKLIIADNELTILGSHNLTSRSLTLNDETSVIIKSAEIAKIYQKYFNNIYERF